MVDSNEICWESIKVGDLGRIVTGKTPKTSQKENYGGVIPFITPSDDMNVKFLRNTSKTLTEIGASSVRGSIIPKGSICVSCIGSDLGKVVITTETSVTNQQINSIIVDESRFDIDYVYYAMLILGKVLNHNSKTSTTVPIVNKSSFSNYSIPCPDLNTQKKISSVLASFDAKIENNNQINGNLLAQAQAIFNERFINNDHCFEWPTVPLKELVDSTLGGDWGKDSPTGNFTAEVYCIRGADIPDVKNGNRGKMPVRFILPKNYQTKALVDGDVVIEISGGSPTQSTGRATVIPQALLDRYDKGMVCTNFCRAIKPKNGLSMFFYFYWQYLYDKRVFFNYENGTTGIKNLDLNGVLSVEEIQMPPVQLIREFDVLCQTLYRQVFSNGLETERLILLRDSLLPKLMSGELDVSELNL